MARWMRQTALSISFISMGERVSLRSRSRLSAAFSGVVTPRAAKTVLRRYEYPALRKRATSRSSGLPMFHFLNFTVEPSFPANKSTLTNLL